jgi:hypothetical protein
MVLRRSDHSCHSEKGYTMILVDNKGKSLIFLLLSAVEFKELCIFLPGMALYSIA